MSLNSRILALTASVALVAALASGWTTRRCPLPAADDGSALRRSPAQTGRVRDEQPVLEIVARFEEWERITDSAASDLAAEDLKGHVNPANAGALVRALPPRLLETPVGLIALETWAGRDRIAAAAWLEKQAGATRFQTGSALRGWIAADREEAHAYAGGLAKGAWKESVLAELSLDAARRREGLDAVLLARLMEPGENRTHLLGQALLVWGRDDPDASVEWVGQIEDTALRNQLIGMNAIGFAAAEPREAAEWLLGSLPPGGDLDRVMGDVVSVWVGGSAPEEAAAWVAALPEGGMRDVAVSKLIERWCGFNPDAAAAWVDKLPAGPLRQGAARDLAGHAVTSAGADGF